MIGLDWGWRDLFQRKSYGSMIRRASLVAFSPARKAALKAQLNQMI